MRKYKWWRDLFFWCHGATIVNAYLLYKYILIRKVSKPLSHYKLRQYIVLENLDPENYNQRNTVVEKRVIKRKDQGYSRGGLSQQKKLDFSPYHQVKDEFIQPKGSLYHRLDTTLHHWPMEVTSHDVLCQLCWWSCGKNRNSEIVICETCGVNLCVRHFKLYHCVTTLVEGKEKINKYPEQYYKDKADKTKANAANKSKKKK